MACEDEHDTGAYRCCFPALAQAGGVPVPENALRSEVIAAHHGFPDDAFFRYCIT